MKHRSTNPSHYYARQADPTMPWKPATWLERNGEFIAALMGAAVIMIALGGIAGALVAGWLS